MDNFTQSLGNRKRKYFSFEERKRLEKLLEQGVSLHNCAGILERAYSTIQGESKRKPLYDRYRAEYAQRDSMRKQENKGNIRKIDKDPKLRSAVVEGIVGDQSPEQIARRIKRMGSTFGISSTISHETIYTFIYTDKEARKEGYYRHLRFSKKYRRKRGERKPREKTRIPERVSIHERPVYIDARKEFGHFETDSVIFSHGKAILSVQYERMTSLARLTKLPDKTATSTASALRGIVHEFDGNGTQVRSVTYDNGTENVLHTELVHTYGIVTYFADTYSSWQKGGVENLNGLIRQYLPRNCDFENMSDDEIYTIQEKLNNRPRKRLNWLTPNEYYAMLTDPNFTISRLFY